MGAIRAWVNMYGARSDCSSSIGLGYVGFEYVRCNAIRPGRCLEVFCSWGFSTKGS